MSCSWSALRRAGSHGVFMVNKSGDARTGHQTQKPLALMELLVTLRSQDCSGGRQARSRRRGASPGREGPPGVDRSPLTRILTQADKRPYTVPAAEAREPLRLLHTLRSSRSIRPRPGGQARSEWWWSRYGSATVRELAPSELSCESIDVSIARRRNRSRCEAVVGLLAFVVACSSVPRAEPTPSLGGRAAHGANDPAGAGTTGKPPSPASASDDGDRDGVDDTHDLCPTAAEDGQAPATRDGCPVRTLESLCEYSEAASIAPERAAIGRGTVRGLFKAGGAWIPFDSLPVFGTFPGREAEAQFLVCIVESKEKFGVYQGGAGIPVDAFQINWHASVLEIATGRVLGKNQFVGAAPPWKKTSVPEDRPVQAVVGMVEQVSAVKDLFVADGGGMDAIVASSDGQKIVSLGLREVVVWRPVGDTLELVSRIKHHTSPIQGAGVDRSGSRLVVLDGPQDAFDRQLTTFDLSSGQILRRVPLNSYVCERVRMTADGARVGCVGPGGVTLYDTDSDTPARKLSSTSSEKWAAFVEDPGGAIVGGASNAGKKYAHRLTLHDLGSGRAIPGVLARPGRLWGLWSSGPHFGAGALGEDHSMLTFWRDWSDRSPTEVALPSDEGGIHDVTWSGDTSVVVSTTTSGGRHAIWPGEETFSLYLLDLESGHYKHCLRWSHKYSSLPIAVVPAGGRSVVAVASGALTVLPVATCQ